MNHYCRDEEGHGDELQSKFTKNQPDNDGAALVR